MKSVWIDVVSKQQFPDGHSDSIELNTEGFCEELNGGFYIQYEETDLTGMEGVYTKLYIYPNYAIIERSGKVRVRQEFRMDTLYETVYSTQMGDFALQMKTVKLKNTLADGKGAFEVGYDVVIEGLGALYNELSITVQEESN